MTFNESVKNVFGNYANFKGRATRSEFWWFYLFTVIVSWGLYVVGMVIGTAAGVGAADNVGVLASMSGGLAVGETLSSIFSLIILVPWLALSVRRLHDVGKSGWFLLVIIIPIVGFILMLVKTLSPSQSTSNAYGPVPQDYVE